jgi:hypothetical protein
MVWENWIALDVILSEKAGNVFWLGASVAHSSPITQFQTEP